MTKFKTRNTKKDYASLVLSLTLVFALVCSTGIAMVKNNMSIDAYENNQTKEVVKNRSTLTAGVTSHLTEVLKEESKDVDLIIKANDVTPVKSSFNGSVDSEPMEEASVDSVDEIEIQGEIENTIEEGYSDIEFDAMYDPEYYEGYNIYETTYTRADSMYVPSGYGKVHTYMGWQCVTNRSSEQYRLRMAAQNFDDEGFGKIGDRYAVAMKPYYGKIGDYLDITQTDGSVYKVVIVDYKGRENAGSWLSNYVHHDNSIIEFVVDKGSWYSRSNGGWASKMHSNPGSKNFHSELGLNITKIVNVGNYWDYDHEKMN